MSILALQWQWLQFFYIVWFFRQFSHLNCRFEQNYKTNTLKTAFSPCEITQTTLKNSSTAHSILQIQLYKSLSEDLFLEGAIKYAVSEKDGRVRTGWDKREGQHWSGPGLECSIEVWCFDGKLWQSWANCSKRGRDQTGPWREKKTGRREDEQPWGSRTLTHSHFCAQVSHTKEEGKQHARNQTEQCKMQRKYFRLLSVPLRIHLNIVCQIIITKIIKGTYSMFIWHFKLWVRSASVQLKYPS